MLDECPSLLHACLSPILSNSVDFRFGIINWFIPLGCFSWEVPEEYLIIFD
jgi:hypothetical protein